MSFVETRQKSVQLGSSRVGVTYPRTLDRWFDDLVTPPSPGVAASKWVHLRGSAKSGYFDVFASVNAPAKQRQFGHFRLHGRVGQDMELAVDVVEAQALAVGVLCVTLP